MIYITDTHSLIWFLSEDAHLSQKARELFDDAEQGEATIIIPTIVLAELLYICERKRVQNKFADIIHKIRSSANYVSYNLDIDIIIKCENRPKIPEIHDKIITATAMILGIPIITKDKEIKSSEYVHTIW